MPLPLLIAAKELRRRFRDRSALVVVFIAPMVLATILSTALNFTLGFGLRLGIVDADGSGIGTQVVSLLRGPQLGDTLEAIPYANRDEALAALRGDDVDALIEIPSGFTAAVQGGREASIEVVRDTDKTIAGDVAVAVAQGAAERVGTVRLGAATWAAAGGEVGPELVRRVAERQPLVQVEDEGAQGVQESAATYYGPAMAIFFLFFTVSIGVHSITNERRDGTLRRLMAAPLRPASLLFGVGLAVFVTGVLAMTTLFVFSTLVLGGDWGDPLAVMALITAVVIAGMGVAALVTALARTDQQSQSVTSVLAMVFALLGGTFVPVSQAPEGIQRLRLLTPHGWAMDGFLTTGFDGGTVADVAAPLLALTLIGVVTGAVALVAGRRIFDTP